MNIRSELCGATVTATSGCGTVTGRAAIVDERYVWLRLTSITGYWGLRVPDPDDLYPVGLSTITSCTKPEPAP